MTWETPPEQIPLDLDPIRRDVDQLQAWMALPIMDYLNVRRHEVLDLETRLWKAVPSLLAEIESLRKQVENMAETIDSMSKSP